MTSKDEDFRLNLEKTAGPTSFSKLVAAASLVALLTLFVYLPALRNDFVNWDDDQYVYENPFIQSLDLKLVKWSFGLHVMNWHPLTWISHALDYAVWGLNPMGHHLSSILLHTANTFLFCILSAKLISASGPRSIPVYTDHAPSRRAVLSASVAALLFGIHPMHVESVAWVAERKDVLSAFFSLLSLLAYCRYAAPHSDGKRLLTYSESLVFFVLALLSKPMAVTLPVTMLIIDFYPLQRIDYPGGIGAFRKLISEKIPFLFFSLISAVLTVIAQRSGGAVVSMKAFPIQERIVTAFRGLWFYLSKMVFPVGLSPFYPLSKEISVFSFKYLIPVVFTILVSVFCVRAWKKGQKIYMAVWAYYIISLLPVIGIIQTGEQAAADRYFYLPSAGFCLLAGLGVSLAWERLFLDGHISLFKKVLVALSLMVALFGLSMSTARQTIVWNDSITLWSHELKHYPDNWLAYFNRASAYTKLGEFQRALDDINKSITYNPGYAKAYYVRAVNYTVLGNYQKAREDLDRAISRDASFSKANDLRTEILGKIAESKLRDVGRNENRNGK